ncbi:hypothetical protein FHS54_001341 [Sphingobium vermicomposti]|uniref:Uncharacterized protein n=1 Tax=Sphingobium vermicomposti TaxID=529005 RepID=A0A846MEX4_9SPHN|nr:hypothetical protein [Sphingobium vermicomposti]
MGCCQEIAVIFRGAAKECHFSPKRGEFHNDDLAREVL